MLDRSSKPAAARDLIADLLLIIMLEGFSAHTFEKSNHYTEFGAAKDHSLMQNRWAELLQFR